MNGFNSDAPFFNSTNVKITSKVERVKIKRVRVYVRSERQSTYRFCSSPFLRNAFLRPPNLKVDEKEVGCDRLSGITLWFTNVGLVEANVTCSGKKVKKPEPFLTLPLLFDKGIFTYFLNVYPYSYRTGRSTKGFYLRACLLLPA